MQLNMMYPVHLVEAVEKIKKMDWEMPALAVYATVGQVNNPSLK
jgi:hypothetical protein